MADLIRAVVVGLGQSGRWLHCRPIAALPELYSLRGVYDARADVRGEVAASLGTRSYPSWEEVLGDDGVNLVVVATPTPYHKRLAIEAALAGKHVVVEKPMAMDAAEALAMIAAAEQAAVTLTVHQNRRWYAEFRTVRKVIEDGLLGKVFSIEKRSSGPPPSGGELETWRAHRTMGGGLLNEMGSHMVDQMLVLMPGRVERVLCTCRSIFTHETEDFFRLDLWFDDGALVVIEADGTAYQPPHMWYVMGTEGTLTSAHDNNWGEVKIVRQAGGLRTTVYPDPLEGGIEEAGRFFYTALSLTLREGAELAVKPAQVLRVIRVLDAARQSAASGEVVRVSI
jgi:scyllo-inositol 2-dehydrogenase (NADP+)